MKPRSDYTYAQRDDGSVHITDLNLGRISVTNDVENVLAAIHEEVDLTGRHVTYTDSEGQTDTLLHDKGVFMRFSPGSQPQPA